MRFSAICAIVFPHARCVHSTITLSCLTQFFVPSLCCQSYAFKLPQFSRQRFSRQLNSRKAHNWTSCVLANVLKTFISISFSCDFKRHLTSHETAFCVAPFCYQFPRVHLNKRLALALELSCFLPFIIRCKVKGKFSLNWRDLDTWDFCKLQ